MVEKEYVGSGQKGIVYNLNDGTALKVFWRIQSVGSIDPEMKNRHAKTEFERNQKAFERGIPVPEPFDLYDITLDREDLDPVGTLKWSEIGARGMVHTKKRSSDEYIDIELPAIRREFIEGKTLYDRLIPDSDVRQKVEKLHDKIDEANLMYPDSKAENYVITPNDKLYIVDCEKFVEKDKYLNHKDWKDKGIATSKPEEWYYILKESFKHTTPI